MVGGSFFLNRTRLQRTRARGGFVNRRLQEHLQRRFGDGDDENLVGKKSGKDA